VENESRDVQATWALKGSGRSLLFLKKKKQKDFAH
jgi:hypothetical protein